jgi:hypothetical protein
MIHCVCCDWAAGEVEEDRTPPAKGLVEEMGQLPKFCLTAALCAFSICGTGSAGVVAMPIDPSIEHRSLDHGAFEPEATAAMGEAFEAVCKELRDAGKADVVRKLVAEQIIGAASRGELDPARLRIAALSWILNHPEVARGFALSEH